eukprot:CAMPEP_0203755712 /NCGR_PEP_ID=MMETSP0098-20131031/9111_1 /ASSEMBLY_ACC=CAM_ASM_000208 /TAXON_ID=96639 /ORGANISM=" , Strain NY0313808BC1" /LENGTH=425 /DNA_ID=CAMNT_0050647291 /DNA_START=277 /DNA_END=1554 /DNA_ORIENTATION=-
MIRIAWLSILVCATCLVPSESLGLGEPYEKTLVQTIRDEILSADTSLANKIREVVLSWNGTHPSNNTIPTNNTVPGNATIPGNITVPGNNTVPGNGTVPTNSTVPGNGTVPTNSTVPGNGTAPANSTASGKESLMLQIPACGPDFTGWKCLEVPFTNATTYCDAVKARDPNATAVQFENLTALYARLHYFLAGNSTEHPLMDSYGYQYFSAVHRSFRYDQTYGLALGNNLSTSVAGREIFETGIGNDDYILVKTTPQGYNATPASKCLQVKKGGEGGWAGFTTSDVLLDKNKTTYCGVDYAKPGYFYQGTEFDVYFTKNTWFAETPVFWFVDRNLKRVAAQLYYQSASPLKGFKTQNYVFDLSYRVYSTEEATKMFQARPAAYFNMNKEYMASTCTNFSQTAFPEIECCGPATNCTLAACSGSTP